jgi:4'-phosphopantetheinyl transferase
VLNSADIHIWLTDPSRATDPGLRREYRDLLPPAERQKCDRYRVPERRLGALVTRALVRTTLSHYCPAVAPREWEFVEIDNGRPELVPGLTALPLRFNLSRTDGLIACAVTLSHAIGVDVEAIDPSRRMAAIMDRYFAPAEQQDVGPDWERFYTYWTLKEAYAKARGVGLSIPLNAVAFDLAAPIRITFDPRIEDDPARWHFAVRRPTPRHLLAVAIDCPDRRQPLDPVARWVLPLRS